MFSQPVVWIIKGVSASFLHGVIMSLIFFAINRLAVYFYKIKELPNNISDFCKKPEIKKLKG